jgi:hypothetical protein
VVRVTSSGGGRASRKAAAFAPEAADRTPGTQASKVPDVEKGTAGPKTRTCGLAGTVALRTEI